MMASFAVCLTVAVRTRRAVKEASERYLQVQREVEQRRESNIAILVATRDLLAGRTVTVVNLEPDAGASPRLSNRPSRIGKNNQTSR
jgi:hypothetical protein